MLTNLNGNGMKKKISLLLLLTITLFLLKFSQREYVLWEWDRGSDLSFLSTEYYRFKNIKVAYLEKSLTFTQNRVFEEKRVYDLRIPETTEAFPVLRINQAEPFREGDKRLQIVEDTFVNMCNELYKEKQIKKCQIDYDVRNSEKEVFRQMIISARGKIEKNVDLSANIIVSWCRENSWVDGLGFLEVVPMYYDMGGESSTYKNYSYLYNFLKIVFPHHCLDMDYP